MNKKIPKVAVITRTQNRGILLERAIKSVQKQTMPDFVQVILNDGGDKKVVDDLVHKHSQLINGRIKVIHNDSQTGHSAALNKAIQSVDSEYIAVHDDDDSWDRDFLKLTTEYLDDKQAHGVITVVDIIQEKIEGNQVIKLKQGRGLEPVRGMVSLYDQCLVNYATPITFAYRRSVIEKIGYYSEEFEVAEDWDFTLRFLMHYDIHSLATEDALAFYHHRKGAEGVQLNSIFTDKGMGFDYHIQRIANHYLRNEIKTGKLGLGYIISSIRHNNNALIQQNTDLNERLNESVKYELHYVAGQVNANTNKATERVNRVLRDSKISARIKNKLFRK